MKRTEAQKISIAALMIALGLIIPFFTSHMFGVPGTILLPMHLPIIIGGLVCGPLYGGIIGFIVPVLSSLLTGMPVVYPMLPLMAVQLIFMGMFAGLFAKHFNTLISSIGGIVGGWVAYSAMLWILIQISGHAMNMTVSSALVMGIPGIVIQLIACPLVAKFINHLMKTTISSKESNYAK